MLESSVATNAAVHTDPPLTPEQAVLQIKELSAPFGIMMVGLPGAGKTTFIKRLRKEIDVVVVSTDDLIEEYAAACGITYDTAFYRMDRNDLEKQCRAKIKEAIANNRIVVIDQTNLSTTVRHRKLGTFRKAKYPHIAVECTSSTSKIKLRQQARSAQGKTIPPMIMQSMVASYQRPQTTEGFSRVFTIIT